MPIKLYLHPRCSTCKNAVSLLEKAGVSYRSVDITETPPSARELKTMLKHQGGEIRKLFNTSGMQYRDANLKDKLPRLSETEALALLAENGMLVKRPFLLSDTVGLVGFKEAAWREHLPRLKNS